ncbi:MAG: hypothetical protein QXU18_10370 [Thermoplasmatales archaeon]
MAGKADSEDSNKLWAEVPSLSELYVEVNNEKEAVSIILRSLSEKSSYKIQNIILERAY